MRFRQLCTLRPKSTSNFFERDATNEAALKIWSEMKKSGWLLYCPCSQFVIPTAVEEAPCTRMNPGGQMWCILPPLMWYVPSSVGGFTPPTQRGLRLPQLPCAQWNPVIFPSISAFFSCVERSQLVLATSGLSDRYGSTIKLAGGNHFLFYCLVTFLGNAPPIVAIFPPLPCSCWLSLPLHHKKWIPLGKMKTRS